MTATERVFIIVNPKAGGYAAGAVRSALERHFPREVPEGEPCCEIHETGPDEQRIDVVREACAGGFAMIGAAGRQQNGLSACRIAAAVG